MDSFEPAPEMGKVLRLTRGQTEAPTGRPRAVRSAGFAASPSEIAARLEVLERSALFFTEHPATLRILARRARAIAVPANTVVVNQGETGDSLFLVDRGRCLLRVETAPGHSIVVAALGPGDICGEDSFVSREGSRVSAVAGDDLSLLAIDRSSLYASLRPDSDLLPELARFAEQRRALFAEMSVQADWGRLTGAGTVLSIYSPKGGTGRTTIAVNLVARLARQRPREVVLVDLALPYPHAALMANLVPTACLARLGETPSEHFEEVLLSSILYHPSGLMVLPGAINLEEADLVTGELVGRAIEVLRRTFRYIVVDLPVAMGDVTLASIDQSQHVFMVITPEITAVKGAADAATILGVLGIPQDRLSLVLNHRTPAAGLSRNAVERGAKRPMTHEIPYDGTRPDEAAVHGGILAVANSKSLFARAIDALATSFESVHEVRGGQPAIEAAGRPSQLEPVR